MTNYVEKITLSFNVLSDGHKKMKTQAFLTRLNYIIVSEGKFDSKEFTRDFHISLVERINNTEVKYFKTFNDKNKLDGYVRSIYIRPDKIGILGAVKILVHFREKETILLGFDKLTIQGKASLKTIAKTLRDNINAKVDKEDDKLFLFGNNRQTIKYVVENDYKPILSEREKKEEKVLKKTLDELTNLVKYIKEEMGDEKSTFNKKKQKKSE